MIAHVPFSDFPRVLHSASVQECCRFPNPEEKGSTAGDCDLILRLVYTMQIELRTIVMDRVNTASLFVLVKRQKESVNTLQSVNDKEEKGLMGGEAVSEKIKERRKEIYPHCDGPGFVKSLVIATIH